MTAGLKVYIDDRELWRRDLTEHSRYGDVCESKRLEDADIQIWHGDVLIMMIERKTIDDLCGSIKDGRFVNQRAKLLHKYDKCRILYLIEGVVFFSERHDDKKYNGLSISVLRGCILNSLVRDGIHCYCCQDYDDMLGMLKNLIDRTRKDPGKYVTASPSVQVVRTLRPTGQDPSRWLMCMLCQLPGISQATATVLASYFKTVRTISACACQGEDHLLGEIRHLFPRKPSHKVITTLVSMYGS